MGSRPFAAAWVAVLVVGAGSYSAEGQPTDPNSRKGTSGMLVFATGGDGLSARQEIAVARPDGSGFRRLTRHAHSAFEPRWTSSGRHIVLSSGSAQWRLDLNGGGMTRVAGGGRAALSPSGRRVALFRPGRILLLTARGRFVRTLRVPWRRGDSPGTVLWSPDGLRLAPIVAGRAPNGHRILVVPSDGRTPARELWRVPSGLALLPVAWSPDGRVLLVHDGNRYTTIRADGTGARRVSSLPGFVLALSWARDSRRIAYVDRRGGLFVADAFGSGRHRVASLRLTHEPRPVGGAVLEIASSPRRDELAIRDLDGVSLLPLGGRERQLTRSRRGSSGGSVTWSPDGSRLVFAELGDVYVVTRRGRTRRVTDTAADRSPTWSADGSAVAFVRDGAVFAIATNGRRERRLGALAIGDLESRPTWSPAAPRVAFDAQSAVVVADLASGRRRRIAAEVATQGTLGRAPVGWSPDGTELAFVRSRGDGTGAVLYVATVSDAAVRPLSTRLALSTHYDLDWSPDGTTIAVAAEGEEIAQVDASTGATRVLRGVRAGQLAWSPDGGALAYAEYDEPLGVVGADGSGRRIIVRRSQTGDAPAWSPDGRRLAFATGRDVYLIDRDGSNRRRVTRTRGTESGVDWTRVARAR